MLLEVRGLTVEIASGAGPVRVVDDVSFALDAGRTLAIVGESGSGKSVLARALVGLAPVSGGGSVRGEVRFRGRDLLSLSDRELRAVRGDGIALVLQDALAAFDPVYPVGRQIAEALVAHGVLRRRQAHARAVELLDAVGVLDPLRVAREYPHRLSGGMRQRALLAMGLACDPDVLIADEPTSALDVTVQAEILELLRTVQERSGTAILLISHDLGVVAQVADDIAVMHGGRIVESAAAGELFERPLHPYTRGMLASLPGSGSEVGSLG